MNALILTAILATSQNCSAGACYAPAGYSTYYSTRAYVPATTVPRVTYAAPRTWITGLDSGGAPVTKWGWVQGGHMYFYESEQPAVEAAVEPETFVQKERDGLEQGTMLVGRGRPPAGDVAQRQPEDIGLLIGGD